ncbi:uncharacterized protein AB675_4491 [Cyphellophora attinorum]|uniref:Uncharacterized protein n=1 Tax=Cyphellophora attinorum TaxID=1664694 RepID=A0A0N1H2N5_9EURO|nr:uncharacterized protein AB675_4491 [Phialophora attinorum]KPI38977.1 hypothetical protein AB675_4491 [Phialophora attinorum]
MEHHRQATPERQQEATAERERRPGQRPDAAPHRTPDRTSTQQPGLRTNPGEGVVAASTTSTPIQTAPSPSSPSATIAPTANIPKFHVNDIVKIKPRHMHLDECFMRVAQVGLKQHGGREVWHYRIGDDRQINESGNDFMLLELRRQSHLKKPWTKGPKVGGEVDFPTLYQGMGSSATYSRGRVVQRIVADGQVYLRVFCPQPVLTLSLRCMVPAEEDRKRPRVGASVTFPTPDQGMGLSVRMTSAKVVQVIDLGHDVVVRLDTKPILTLNLNGIVVAPGDETEATDRGEVSDAPWASEVEAEATDEEEDDQEDDYAGEHIDSEGLDIVMSDDGGGNDLENWLPERHPL